MMMPSFFQSTSRGVQRKEQLCKRMVASPEKVCSWAQIPVHKNYPRNPKGPCLSAGAKLGCFSITAWRSAGLLRGREGQETVSGSGSQCGTECTAIQRNKGRETRVVLKG